MSAGGLLSIQPSELKFLFELRKQSSCSITLTNKSEKYVAFKFKTTNPKRYCVRPNSGIVPPRSSCNVTVSMQAPKEAPPDMQCKDKFLLQTVVAPDGTTSKDVIPEMFTKQDGRVVGEMKLRVVYVRANPPSPVPEGSEEDTSPRASTLENGDRNAYFEDESKYLEEHPVNSTEGWSLITRLTDEKASALRENQRLLQELELMRKEIRKNRDGGFSVLVVALIAILSIMLGYYIKST